MTNKTFIILCIAIVCSGNYAFRAYGQNSFEDEQKTSLISNQISLSSEDIELFKGKSNEKIDEFTKYIVIIADKSQMSSKRNLAEREALKLFTKDATMETSTVKPDKSVVKKVRPMAEYLYRLKTLPYLKVSIRFYDICYVNSFTRGEDGSYYGTATVFQEFTGFSGDKIVYHDITKKEITIIINIIEDEFFNEKRWQVFLGDVKASETSLK
jgi:hypothetical protein